MRNADGVLVPTSYAEPGFHGLSGGHMRVIAAACLVRAGGVGQVVFTGGRSRKMIRLHGPGAPSSAGVFADAFARRLGGCPSPAVVLEETGSNTASDLTGALGLIGGGSRVGLLSNSYHLERIGLLARELVPARVEQLVLLSAEQVVRRHLPGAHDIEIAAAYATPEAARRRLIEARGVADLRNGRYDFAEQGP